MFKPIPLNLPPFPAKLSQAQDQVFIFDPLRKKNLVLTPEEWVRQHWIHHLMTAKNYPLALMQTEGGLKLNTLQKRSDLLIFNNLGEKILLAEFKAPHVKITQAAFDQIARYNTIHKIPLLLVSNGLQHYYCTVNFESNAYKFLEELPSYGDLIRK
ncbi:type I restriction enzyme HsdR N-terminal domain-containing protein [Sphingobacteriaceae bacterium WQ 2009]|uniref:Type I restriction enzyme HsdR N-terminal domain-containing protein n=1 Tax=Rhinopithecimicrobium faecis TaxID=2820698 RepID=A0A8T4H9N5_9SPHI|nr:type I restriction enzyme HsdR N-terminal domain-containing protein [Sphingobacteriaceae bacterium WQ 2009]